MNKQSGLTLLELLIALGLVALIAIGLSSATQLGMAAYLRTIETEHNLSETAARGQLRRWMSLASPPRFLVPYSAKFRGETDRVSFVTHAYSGHSKLAAALLIEVEQSTEGVVFTTTQLDDKGDPIAGNTRSLVQNARNVSFSYFDSTQNEWVDQWRKSDSLPNLITIEIETENHKFWPEFTVELIYSVQR